MLQAKMAFSVNVLAYFSTSLRFQSILLSQVNLTESKFLEDVLEQIGHIFKNNYVFKSVQFFQINLAIWK